MEWRYVVLVGVVVVVEYTHVQAITGESNMRVPPRIDWTVGRWSTSN